MPNIRTVARRTRRQLFGAGMGTLAGAWDDTLAAFQQKRMELDQAESDLWTAEFKSQISEDDRAAWRDALSRVQQVKAAMDRTGAIITGASDAWQSTTDFFGLNGVNIGRTLGALPFALPTVAGLAGLIAAATAAITIAYSLIAYVNSKTDRFSQLVNAGVDAVTANAEATKTAQAESGYSLPARIEGIVKYAVLGIGVVALVFLLRK